MQVAGEHSVKCVYGHHCLGRVGRSCQMPNQMSRLSTPFTEYACSRAGVTGPRWTAQRQNHEARDPPMGSAATERWMLDCGSRSSA